jgi:hypothetical protein
MESLKTMKERSRRKPTDLCVRERYQKARKPGEAQNSKTAKSWKAARSRFVTHTSFNAADSPLPQNQDHLLTKIPGGAPYSD